VLAHDPDIAWLDRRHLQNWWRLALPPGIDRNARFAIVVLAQGELIHAIRSGEGALPLADVPFSGTKRGQLVQLKKALEVEGLLVLEEGALVDLFATMEQGLQSTDNFATQGVGLWQCLRKAEGVWSDPPLLDLIPPLRVDALQKTFNLLVPNKSTLAAYVFDEEQRRVHCSVIAMKEEGQVTLATMHPAIRDLVTERELSRDWREQYSRVNQALTSRFAKPSIAVFVERGAVDRILRGPADQLARELRERNVIVDPAPLWLQGLLGGVAAVAVAGQSAKRMARFLPKGARRMAGDLAGAAQERMKTSGANPFAKLGFDPIELLQQLRSFYADPKH
jgi:hypothetical protein